MEVGAITGKLTLDTSQAESAVNRFKTTLKGIQGSAKTTSTAMATSLGGTAQKSVSSLGTAIGRTESDIKSQISTMQKLLPTVRKGGYDYNRLSREIEDCGKELSGQTVIQERMRESMMVAGSVAMHFAIVMGAIGAAAFLATKSMLTMAAAAEETRNLFEVSMGAMSSAANRWVKSLNASLGISTMSLQKMIGTFNVMLSSMGLAETKAYGMSKALTRLAFDMASFYNLPIESAFQKLSAGLAGEIEPLKRLGILVNDNAVAQYALSTGMAKASKDLTDQQKVVARYNLILEQTKMAQGDMARTLGSLTNQWRVAGSQVEELTVTMGTHLADAAKSLLGVFNSLVGSLNSAAKALPTLAAGLSASAAAAAVLFPILAAIALLTPGLMAYSSALGIKMGALAIKTGALATAVAALIGAWTVFQKSITHVYRDAILDNEEKIKTIKNLQELEVRYTVLKSAMGSSSSMSLELKESTKQLKDVYKELKMSVDDTATAFGNMAIEAAERQIVKVEEQLKSLREEILALDVAAARAARSTRSLWSLAPSTFLGGDRAGFLSGASYKREQEEDLEGELKKLNDIVDPVSIKLRNLAAATKFASSQGIEMVGVLEKLVAEAKMYRQVLSDAGESTKTFDKYIADTIAKIKILREGEADANAKGLGKLIGETGAELQARISSLKSELAVRKHALSMAKAGSAATVEYTHDIRRLTDELKRAEDELHNIKEAGKNVFEKLVGESESKIRSTISALKKLQFMLSAGLGPVANTAFNKAAVAKALADEIKKLTGEVKTYGDRMSEAGVITEDSIKKQIELTMELIPLAEKLGKARDVESLKRQLEELNITLNRTGEAARNLGIDTTRSIEKQIEDLRQLRDARSDDALIVRQTSDEIRNLQEVLASTDSDTLVGGFTAGLREIGEEARNVGETIRTSLVGAYHSVQTAFENAFAGVVRGTMTAKQALLSLANSIIDSILKTVARMIWQATIGRLLATMATTASIAQATAITLAWTKAATLVSIATYGSAAIVGAGAVIAALAANTAIVAGFQAASAGAASGASAAGGLETGTNFVPYTGMYRLHKGEEVVPKPYVDRDVGGARDGMTIYNLVVEEAVARAMQGMAGRNTIINVIAGDAEDNGRTRKAIRRHA